MPTLPKAMADAIVRLPSSFTPPFGRGFGGQVSVGGFLRRRLYLLLLSPRSARASPPPPLLSRGDFGGYKGIILIACRLRLQHVQETEDHRSLPSESGFGETSTPPPFNRRVLACTERNQSARPSLIARGSLSFPVLLGGDGGKTERKERRRKTGNKVRRLTSSRP